LFGYIHGFDAGLELIIQYGEIKNMFRRRKVLPVSPYERGRRQKAATL
jgi:hypothetical protein